MGQFRLEQLDLGRQRVNVVQELLAALELVQVLRKNLENNLDNEMRLEIGVTRSKPVFVPLFSMTWKVRNNFYLWRNDWNRDASKYLTLLHLQQLTEKAGTN